MSSQNDRRSISEGISIRDEEKVAVQYDDKTINDEIDDYVFGSRPHSGSTPGSHRGSSHHRSGSHHHSSGHYHSSSHHHHSGSHHHHSRSRHYSRSRKNLNKLTLTKSKKILIGVASAILALIIVAVSIFSILTYLGKKRLLTDVTKIRTPEGVTSQDGLLVEYNGHFYKYNPNITSVLFLGVDTETLSYNGVIGQGGQADVIMLLTYDTKTGKSNLINISRDTIGEVAVYSTDGNYVKTENEQICLAYAYGDGKETSCQNQVISVQRLFYDVPINSYYALDLNGINTLNDAVGGVDVTSPETIDVFRAGETYHLKGDMAESFVRSRTHESVEGNSLRMERQKTYVTAFAANLIQKTKQDVTTPVTLFNKSSEYSYTDIGAAKVCYFGGRLNKYGLNINVLSVPGELTQNGDYAEFRVDYDNFYQTFLDVFYNRVS